jgi:hypothetical protein
MWAAGLRVAASGRAQEVAAQVQKRLPDSFRHVKAAAARARVPVAPR